MGSAATLAGLDKVYTALHRSIGPKTGNRADAERDDRLYGEVPVTLYPTLTDSGPIFHVRVADEVETEGAVDKPPSCRSKWPTGRPPIGSRWCWTGVALAVPVGARRRG